MTDSSLSEPASRADQFAYLIGALRPDLPLPAETDSRWLLLRSLMNTRPPGPISPEWLLVQDEVLRRETQAKGATRIGDLKPIADGVYLWQGDITTLHADAIVNAANSAMLGCFHPLHRCIDNAIHTYAGIQLREECTTLMRDQGHPEPTGSAKLTGAYNLPAKHVIHTVGPIVAPPHERRPRTACRLLLLLPHACHGRRPGVNRLLLHLHRRVPIPESGGGQDRRPHRRNVPSRQPSSAGRDIQRLHRRRPPHLQEDPDSDLTNQRICRGEPMGLNACDQ